MLGQDAMEFLKTLHNLDNIWNEVEDAEYNDRQLTQFAERYHEHKLKSMQINRENLINFHEWRRKNIWHLPAYMNDKQVVDKYLKSILDETNLNQY